MNDSFLNPRIKKLHVFFAIIKNVFYLSEYQEINYNQINSRWRYRNDKLVYILKEI